MNVCYEFGIENDVVYNSSKSVAMSRKQKGMRKVKIPNFILGSIPLVSVDKVRYLGHIITEDMTDELDIASQNKSLFVRGNMTINMFHICLWMLN